MIFLGDREGVMIHHTADRDAPDTFDVTDIRRYHMHERRWSDIGYNFVAEYVRGNPEIIVGRGFDVGAHCRGYNLSFLGFAFNGNFSEDEIQQDLLECGAKFVAALLLHTKGRLLRHSDVAATECPGLRFPWRRFESLVGDLLL